MMKKKIFLLAFGALMMVTSICAQDIIVTTDAQKIEAKILEVSKTEIKYKEKDNLDGPTFIIETKEISSIIYANGKVVLYNQTADTQTTTTPTPPASETISTPQTTTSETTLVTGQDYNVEILLLSGHVIKGKLMELANSYVAYTLNAKYYTIPASQVEKVTDIRNGSITIYNGKNLDKQESTSATTSSSKSNENEGRIYRDNGHYLHNGTYISSKEVERILARENGAAYTQWKKANGMLIGGSICAGIGGGLVLGGLFPLIHGNTKATIGIECAAFVPLAIGLGLTLGSSASYNKAIDIYNSKYDRAAIQLKWHVAANGVGLAIAF